MEITDRAWRNPGHTYWFISPTYDQAKVQYRRLVSMLFKSPEIMIKKNQTELRLKFINMSEICFKSGEAFDHLRGQPGLNGVVIDEVRDQHKDLWPMIIRPMLTTTQGWASFVGTPNGYDHFFDIFEFAKQDKEWETFQLPSTANPLFTKEEHDAAQKDMSQAQFDQEILAQFRDIHRGRVCSNFGEHNIVETNPFAVRGEEWSRFLPIVVGMDFNVTPMCWHLGQYRAGQIYWGDRLWLEDSNTLEASEELVARVMGSGNGNLILCGDATGKARKTSSAGKTDYDILHETLRRHKIKYEDITPEENPFVKDRVNTWNARLKSASGEISIFISRKCKELIRDNQRLTWKVGADAIIDKSDPMLTHAFDSASYPVCQLMPIQPIGEVGGVWVMRR